MQNRAPTGGGGVLTVYVESCPSINFDPDTGLLLDEDDFITINFGALHPGDFKGVVYSGYAFSGSRWMLLRTAVRGAKGANASLYGPQRAQVYPRVRPPACPRADACSGPGATHLVRCTMSGIPCAGHDV